MTPFTDKELTDMKERIMFTKTLSFHDDYLERLLNRLDAAEKVVEGHSKHEADKINYDTFVGLLKAWRKSCGK